MHFKAPVGNLVLHGLWSRFGCWMSGGGRGVALAGTSTGPLASNHRSLDEQLSTPHTPRLRALERSGQALGLERAGGAQRLRVLDVRRRFGEEEFWRVGPTGQVLRRCHLVEDIEEAHAHSGHLPVTCGADLLSSETVRSC